MELTDALRTTGSVRSFEDESIPDAVLYDILNDARFAPSGGNRQAWHVIVVKDDRLRRALRDLYLDGWHDYIAHVLAGLVPFSPLASDEDRALALTKREAAIAASRPDGFPETLERVPVMLVICADLNALAATDRDLGRYQIAGGASIYPFVWSILLAARERGLGGVMTTIATRNEPGVRELLDMPEDQIVASIVVLGRPKSQLTKLNRRSVEEFTTTDTYDGERFTGSSPKIASESSPR
jgi:nitroreductase